jgi:predicted RNase H-like nuclease
MPKMVVRLSYAEVPCPGHPRRSSLEATTPSQIFSADQLRACNQTGCYVGMMWFAGIDGCRNGWCVVLVGDELRARVVATFAEVLRLPEKPQMIAIDMPIGLARVPGRTCDALARKLLPGRASTIFSPPARAALDAGDYAATCAANRATAPGAPAISLQAFHLLPKLRELDAAMTPGRQRRIREAHPELAFAEVAGRMLPNKKTPSGRRARTHVLEQLGLVPPPVRGAARDDLLDATILCWTARRIFDKTARVLGGDRDERGLRMEIVT